MAHSDKPTRYFHEIKLNLLYRLGRLTRTHNRSRILLHISDHLRGSSTNPLAGDWKWRLKESCKSWDGAINHVEQSCQAYWRSIDRFIGRLSLTSAIAIPVFRDKGCSWILSGVSAEFSGMHASLFFFQ